MKGPSKISSSFTLHLIKAGKFKRVNKVSSDLQTILMTDLTDLRFLELRERQNMSVNLNYVVSHQLCVKFLILVEVIKIYLS